MANNSKLSQRFAELTTQLETIEATKKIASDGSGETFVDPHLHAGWSLKARHLLSMACGEDSQHYDAFAKAERSARWGTNYERLLNQKAVFEAAREDFEGGYLNTVRSMVQAEVFANELEQARELLRAGYETPAAVVAGVVLETTLRQLCDNHQIQPGSLNKMNADLTKAGAYNLLKQKQITAWADIRNNAAHGHPEKFTKADVEDMIDKVEAFVADQLSSPG